MPAVRVDRYLWAIRLFPTRTASTEACRAGHVRVNGARAKPANDTRVGDRIEIRLAARSRVVEVVDPIAARVSASLAALAFRDLTPRPSPDRSEPAQAVRERSTGRPTKRDRRRLDRARGR